MDRERFLAVPDESLLINALSEDTQEIILRDIREYELEKGICFARDETGKYMWLKNPFSELKKAIYSGTNLIYCEPEEVKKLYDKSRTYCIPIKLSKTDFKKLCYKAGVADLTVGGLLENFIGDLIGGERTNGSDERMYVEQWFERCWFSFDYGTTSFLSYLCNTDMTDYIEGLLEELEYYDSIDKLDNYEKMERQEVQQELEEIFSNYKEECKVEDCCFEEEIKKVKNWLNERENYMNHTELYQKQEKNTSR